jgi:hypothetical protein
MACLIAGETHVRFCVGVGNNSKNGKAVLGPAVEGLLDEMDLSHCRDLLGVSAGVCVTGGIL